MLIGIIAILTTIILPVGQYPSFLVASLFGTDLPCLARSMSFLEILILAVVQGLTEFLPVSSSGHLVVTNALLEMLGKEPTQDLIEVSIVLHLGTLASVLVYYRQEIARLFTKDRQLLPLLILGTLPAAVVGVGIKKGLSDSAADGILENVLLAGWMFPVTALLLVLATRLKQGETPYTQLTWRNTLLIGIAQALAILPGISRSGSTIAAGLLVGLDRQSASTFAFLLAIPAILGAGLLETLDILDEGSTGTSIGLLLIGFVVSFAVGLGALSLLIRWVKKGKLDLFAWYLVPLGVVVVAWQMLG